MRNSSDGAPCTKANSALCIPYDRINSCRMIRNLNNVYTYSMTSCAIRALHGLHFPTFLIHFQPAFLKPLFSPVVPAVLPLCKCATHSLPFQWLRSLLPLVFIFPTLCKSSTCMIWLRRDRLSRHPHQTIQPASIKPLVPSFLKTSLPLQSLFLLSAGVSLPFVVSSRSSCSSRSSFFSCSSRYSVLTSGSVRKMDNFLAFSAPRELPEEIIKLGYLS